MLVVMDTTQVTFKMIRFTIISMVYFKDCMMVKKKYGRDTGSNQFPELLRIHSI